MKFKNFKILILWPTLVMSFLGSKVFTMFVFVDCMYICAYVFMANPWQITCSTVANVDFECHDLNCRAHNIDQTDTIIY